MDEPLHVKYFIFKFVYGHVLVQEIGKFVGLKCRSIAQPFVVKRLLFNMGNNCSMHTLSAVRDIWVPILSTIENSSFVYTQNFIL